MILALNKHAALYVFSSTRDAERELEAIDVRQDEFEFCDATGQRYAVVYSIPPRGSRLGLLRTVDIGAFTLTAQGDVDLTLPESFIERTAHIEHTSIPALTSIEALRDEIRANAVYYSYKCVSPCCDGNGQLVFITCPACGRVLLECTEDTTVFGTPPIRYEDAIACNSDGLKCSKCQKVRVCAFRPSTIAEIETLGLASNEYTTSH